LAPSTANEWPVNLHTFIPATPPMRRLAAGCAFIASLGCGVLGQVEPPPPPTEPIAVGQKLTIQLGSWAVGGMIKIKGNNEDLPFVLELAEHKGEKVVMRWSNVGGTPTLSQHYGGWPFGAQPRAVKVTLAATKTKWQVSVDDQRLPWLDFTHPEGETYAGYEVSASLPVVGTPVVDGITCSVNCGLGECRCGGNPEDCQVKPVQPGFNGQLASCVFAIDANSECCTGAKPVLDLDGIQEGDVVKVVDAIAQDPTYLDRACLAIGAFGLCPEIKKAQPAGGNLGSKLLVMSRFRDEDTNIPDGRVLVYFPTSHAKLVASPWMFVKEEGAERTIPLTGPPGLIVDQGTGMVKWLNYELNNGNSALRAGDYLIKLEQNRVTWQYTPARLRQFAASGSQYSVIVSDAPRLLPEPRERCQSRVGWRDSATTPMGCARYGGEDGGEPWCTKFGLATPAWRRERGGIPFDTFKRNGESALEACCFCGGGTPS